MKKNVLTLAILAVSITAFGQTALSTISGVWERQGSLVSLFSVVSGRLEPQSVYVLQDGDRSFAFAFAPKTEGYYVIGVGDAGIRPNKYIFYFKPGDELSLTVNDTSYVLTGDNTRENIALTQWHDRIQPLEYEAWRVSLKTYVDMFPVLEKIIENEFVPTPTGNRTFDESFANYRKFDLMHCATAFVTSRRTAHPQKEDFPDYYRTLSFGDITANAVSFSDFKGKVVYVDVWATWCGPCRMEFPYLKAVEKEFHGNDNIVFVSISSDADKDIQKWKDLVAFEGLPGVQLHGGKDIATLFGISSIPQFMLFDKEGNIVSIDAPRPSSSDLLPLLRQLAK